MLEAGERGHLGPAASIVEILRVLYDNVLDVRPQDPDWENRDRFILSKGHGCMALYAILADKGFFDSVEFERFCRTDGLLGGHPETRVPGVEASTGSLGHGLSLGVGMALAARIRGLPYKVIVLVGDGEINEGAIWEAALSAKKHRLNELTLLIDRNRLQSFGETSDVLDLEPLNEKLESFGFATRETDGHDVNELSHILSGLPFAKDRPSAVICHTVKGKGFALAENDPKWHHSSRLSEEHLHALKASLLPVEQSA